MTTEFWTILAASIVAVFGVARLTRLTSEDNFPPVAAVRNWWIARFNKSNWSELAICPFCQAPYHAAIAFAWGWLSDLHWSWWAFYGWLALAYAAAIVVARDIPNADGD